ncbi:MAG: DNA polymerase III subunit gamma and tau [Actinomycetales bacterium]|nr:DNA polymerase III subunit gamma and tau [Actinomycetales bacterium]
MSMALYRTYRPTTLAEVVGQEHVTAPLSRALANDRVHHAYLFSGPRGCGKTSTARILARSLNCEQGPTPEPCGTCASCLDLAANGPGSIDVIELDAASHGGVDDTRDLRERAMFAPASSRYKVYIIDEAHMVTTQGFNALLKLVEEPPPHVRFIFATTEVDKVLPTIRSRTHNYTFRLVSAKALQQHLAWVCEAEGIPAEPTALALVARAGAGSVRDSLSILGQVISGAGPEGVTYADAVGQLGMTDATLLDEMVQAMADLDGPALFTVIDRVSEAGHEPRRFVTDLLERMRDLIVLTHVPGAVEAGLVDGPPDQVEREVAQAAMFGAAELARAAEVVSESLSALKGATAPRLQLELMGARLLLPAVDADERGLRARMDQLERRMASGAVIEAAAPASVPAPEPERPAAARKLSQVAPSTAPSSQAKRAPGKASGAAATSQAEPAAAPSSAPPSSPSSSNGVTLQDMRSMWPAILDATKAYSKVAWILFSSSVPLSYDNGVLAVGLKSAGDVTGARASGHDERIRQAVLDVMRVDVRVDVVHAPEASLAVLAADAPAPDAPSPDDADVVEESGVELAIKTLGATTIGEIEH